MPYMDIVMNHAESLDDRSEVSEGSKIFRMIGIPIPTARPPTLAMNILTEVRMVISSVSRVSDALSAP